MNKFAFIILYFISIFFSFQASAITVTSGNWLVDKSREVNVGDFNYLYSLEKVHFKGHFLELEDGSVWQIEELSSESKSFYANQTEPVEVKFVEELVEEWQPGEQLIFHKIFDREYLLAYNVNRNLLINVTPLLPPSKESALRIANIDQKLHLLTLSDGSVWEFYHLCPCRKWQAGNPIIVAKNTPLPWGLFSDDTHLLINLHPCECDATVQHIHPNRLGVKQVSGPQVAD